MSTAHGAVRLPRLTSRAGVIVGVGTAVAVVAVTWHRAVTQPENRWAAAIVLVLLLAGVLLAWSDARFLDLDRGAVQSSRLWVLRRSVSLGHTSTVRLVPNRGGGLMLAVEPHAGRRMYVMVLLLSNLVERSLPADVLRLLADTVVRYGAVGGGEVAADLRAQADHLEGGGSAPASPLAVRITQGALTAGAIGAAGSAAGHL